MATLLTQSMHTKTDGTLQMCPGCHVHRNSPREAFQTLIFMQTPFWLYHLHLFVCAKKMHDLTTKEANIPQEVEIPTTETDWQPMLRDANRGGRKGSEPWNRKISVPKARN
jgi:hypothetical protein